MRVYCDLIETFKSLNKDEYRQLERLLMRVRIGQHELIIEELDEFFTTDFFITRVAPANQEEVRELLERQSPTLADRGLDPVFRDSGPYAELVPVVPAERTCCRRGKHPVWTIDPTNAGEWSESPLRLLLENDADWILIEAAAGIYRRSKVVEALTKGFLRKEQRGGKTEVKKAVEQCALSDRVFVLMDSDRMAVDGEEDHPQRKVREMCKLLPNVLPFILKKRELENYVPATVWREAIQMQNQRWPRNIKKSKERAQRLREWELLSEDKKDVVDLEEYFPEAKKLVIRLLEIKSIDVLEARAGSELDELLCQLEAWL